jgi:hypothetical protein
MDDALARLQGRRAAQCVDSKRCQATGKLKTLCYCDECRTVDASEQVQEQAAWAERRRLEKQEELELLRSSGKGTVVASVTRQDSASEPGGTPPSSPRPKKPRSQAAPSKEALDLADGWEEVTASDGRVYYWEQSTDAVSWTRPLQGDAAAAPAAAALPAAAPAPAPAPPVLTSAPTFAMEQQRSSELRVAEVHSLGGGGSAARQVADFERARAAAKVAASHRIA